MPRAEDSDDRERPQLKSLAQAARGNQLKQIRGTLFAIGILTILLNGFQLFILPGEVRAAAAKQGPAAVNAPGVPDAVTIGLVVGYAIAGSLILLGLIFLLFGALVRSYPVPITIAALVLFTIPAVACGLANLASGWIGLSIMNVFCIIGLAKAVGTAFAYQREQRAQLAAVEGDFDDEDEP